MSECLNFREPENKMDDGICVILEDAENTDSVGFESVGFEVILSPKSHEKSSNKNREKYKNDGSCFVCRHQIWDLSTDGIDINLHYLDASNELVVDFLNRILKQKTPLELQSSIMCCSCFNMLERADTILTKASQRHKALYDEINSIIKHFKRHIKHLIQQSINNNAISMKEDSSKCDANKLDSTYTACPNCSGMFLLNEDLIEHFESTHNSIIIACQKCGDNFLNINFYLIHSKTCDKKENPKEKSPSKKRKKPAFDTKKVVKKDQLETYQSYCEECNRGFKNDLELREHCLLVHNEGEVYTCHLCMKTYDNIEDRDKHASTDHPLIEGQDADLFFNEILGVFVCPICNKSINSKNSLVRHIESLHYKIKPYKCNLCKQCYYSEAELKTHNLVSHQNKPEEPDIRTSKVTCPKCNRDISQRSYRQHMLRMHSDIRQAQCPLCPKSYTTKTQLAYHVSFNHPEEAEDLIKQNVITKSVERVQCNFCLKIFSHHSALRRHILCKHPGAQKFDCSFCPKTFCTLIRRDSHESQRHLKSKKKKVQPGFEVMFEVDKADYFIDVIQDDLQDGKVQIKNERYELEDQIISEELTYDIPDCITCQETFSSVTEYNEHLRNCDSVTERIFQSVEKHDNDDNVVCPTCKNTVSYGHLFRHISELHTQELLYCCKHCKAIFNKKSSLISHAQTVHGEEFSAHKHSEL